MPATIYSATRINNVERIDTSAHRSLYSITGQVGIWTQVRLVAARPELVPTSAAPAAGNLFATIAVHEPRDPLYGVNEFTRDSGHETNFKSAATGL